MSAQAGVGGRYRVSSIFARRRGSVDPDLRIETLRRKFYDTGFVRSPPAGRVIKSYADTILLLSTFMFAFTVMHVSAVNRHDLDEADDDWMELCDNATRRELVPSVTRSLCGDHFVLPSVQLATSFTTSYLLLGSSLLVSIMAYLAMIFSQIDEETKPQSLENWWKYYQWPMHAAVGLLTAGTVSYGMTMELTARITFLDVRMHLDTSEGFVLKELQAIKVLYVVIGAVGAYMMCAHVAIKKKKKKKGREDASEGRGGGGMSRVDMAAERGVAPLIDASRPESAIKALQRCGVLEPSGDAAGGERGGDVEMGVGGR